MNQDQGFIEFASNEDWFQEDRMTTALRDLPKPRMSIHSDEQLARSLDKAILGGNLNALEISMAEQMRDVLRGKPSGLDDAGYADAAAAAVAGDPAAPVVQAYNERHR